MPPAEAKVCLMGYSGHGYVVAEALKLCGYTTVSYADLKINEDNPFQLTYVGFEGKDEFPWDAFDVFVLGVGDNNLRTAIAQRVRERALLLIKLIHPAASVSEYAEIGNGTFIARGACINPLVQIGTDAIVNTGASIDHECRLGAGVHIAPGAVLAGDVTVEDLAMVGANAVIKEGLTIGRRAIIGAGAVVVKDIAPDTIVAGNPARPIG